MALILLADDDLECGQALRAALEGEGHMVSEAFDGQDTYEKALLEGPDLVIVSGALPVFSGLETSRLLRDDPSLPSSLPILLVAGDCPDSRTLEKAGVTAFLPRHCGQSELRELLTRCLGEKAGMGE